MLYAVEMIIPNYPFRPVKIGYSNDPIRRVGDLTQGPFPTSLLGQWEGERQDEKDFHRRFVQYRLYGEWFFPHPDLMKCVHTQEAAECKPRPRLIRFQKRIGELFSDPRPLTTLPDPYDFPFSMPHELEVDRYMESLALRWPMVGKDRCRIKRDQVVSLTGIPGSVVHDSMMCLLFPTSTRRYAFEHVREFLMEYPSYLKANAVAA